MAKKDYRFEGQVARGWGGVMEIKVAFGTDDIKELRTLINETSESMQDQADDYQKKLMAVEEKVREAQQKFDEQTEEPAEEPAEAELIESDNNES